MAAALRRRGEETQRRPRKDSQRSERCCHRPAKAWASSQEGCCWGGLRGSMAPHTPRFSLQPTELSENEFLLFEDTQFLVVCYRSLNAIITKNKEEQKVDY